MTVNEHFNIKYLTEYMWKSATIDSFVCILIILNAAPVRLQFLSVNKDPSFHHEQSYPSVLYMFF